MLCELERVVGVGLSRGIRILLHAEAQVECAHRALGDVVYLALQECVEGVVHGHVAARLSAEIHSRGEHRHSQFSPFLHAHRRQLVLHRHVLGRVERELQPHVAQGPGDLHTAVEHHAAVASSLRHESLHPLRGGDVQSRVHDVAREFHIASLADGEGLQRYHGQLVFHVAAVDGVSSEELHSVEVRICHPQLSSSLDVHVVRLVRIEHTLDSGSLLHVHHQQHVESVHLRLRGLIHLGGVAEVGECHQFAQPVACVQRRVAQYVCHVGRTEHVERSPHVEFFEWSLHQGSEIDERLSVSHRLRRFLGTDYLIVVRLHLQVHRHTLGAREIHVAIHRERTVVVAVQRVVLKQQVASHNPHGVVVASHHHTVGHALDVGRVKLQLAVHLRACQRSCHGEMSLGISVEPYQLVGHESVHQRQRRAHEVERGVEISVAAVVIPTAEQSYLLAVAHYVSLHPVAVQSVLQIDKLAADVAHGHLLVCHSSHAHVRHHGYLLLGVLHEVEVAVHHSRQLRHKRHHRRHLPQVELVDAHGQVLQHGRVFPLAEHLHSCAVLGNEVNLGIHPSVAPEEHVVVLVELECLVSYQRHVWRHVHVDSAVAHLRHHSHVQSLCVVLVVELRVGTHPLSVEVSVDHRLEHEPRVALVVLHEQSEVHPGGVLPYAEPHCVYRYAVHGHLVYVSASSHSALWRRAEVYREVLEVKSLVSQHVGYWIIISALDAQAECRQQFAQLLLVDHLLPSLLLHLSHEPLHLLHQQFISPACLQVELQVAAVGLCPRGVGGCVYVEFKVLGAVCLLLGAHGEVVDDCLQAVALI